MKLALAQINARLGDLEGICSRIERQLTIAQESGVDLMCLPAPLLCGVTPGTLVESTTFEHDVLKALERIAQCASEREVACLVPAVLALESGQLFEVFLLKEGRVVPLRLTMVRHQESVPVSPWSPPVFEVAGTRIATTFDAARDMSAVPSGCDLLVYFPVNGFDMTNALTTSIAAVPKGGYSAEVERAGVWFACMEPIGGFDDAVYTGGSFVMDDGGRVVAQAPCFEEALLIQDVCRGMMAPVIENHDLPTYEKDRWLWEALRLHLRDAIDAYGARKALLLLDGSLQSTLLAALAVDALGSRNVLGLLVAHENVDASGAMELAGARDLIARDAASRLGIELIERSAPSASLLFDEGHSVGDGGLMRGGIDSMLMADVSRAREAVPLSPLTKTDYALRANAVAQSWTGALAPFGDVYLSEIERLAASRLRSWPGPSGMLFDGSVGEAAWCAMLNQAVSQLAADDMLTRHALRVLSAVAPAEIDGALKAHVDQNASIDDLDLSKDSPEAAALLMMMVRRNEPGRRMLPACPIVSARAFVERSWPAQLAWSDMGFRTDERLRAADFADAEYRRLERRGSERAVQARGEIFEMLGAMLGLSPEQQRAIMGEAAQEHLRDELLDAGGDVREMLRHMVEGGDSSRPSGHVTPGEGDPLPDMGFFSLN